MDTEGGGDFNDFDDSDDDKEYHPKLSILEKEYMEKARVRQKEGIVKPQIVHRKEFKGTSFISKPEHITFKDFTVGVSHVQTILLTNVSFSFNSFKLLQLNDEIQDFFDIKYTPSGRMSAGLSTTIQITFTPQLNQDINSFLPLLSETGPINVPLVCTCKKALISIEEPIIDFAEVIYGEQATRNLRVKNLGALETKIYARTHEGKEVPVLTNEDLDLRRENEILNLTRERDEELEAIKQAEEDLVKRREEFAEAPPVGDTPEEQEENKLKQEVSFDDEVKEFERRKDEAEKKLTALVEECKTREDPFEDFCVQVKFARINEIGSYTSKNISLTFIPYKMGPVFQELTLFLENQDYTEPIPIVVKGECIDVPIYVEHQTYDLRTCIYEKTYRDKIILFNRSANTMKIQLYFPKELKGYLEFNPTLGYIQGKDKFEIWMKFRPDRTILTNAKKFIHDDTSISIPIKVVGANQIIPVKFNIIALFTVDAITFNPPQVNFGNIFHLGASRVTINMENHSLLPQKFFFVNLPKELSVETDNGCGVVLPGESYPIAVAYRPTQQNALDEGKLSCRIISGDICSREIKISYSANILKAPLKIDKCLIDFKSLPENEDAEAVIEITNPTQKNFTIEMAPPNAQISGLYITPVVMQMTPGKKGLISMTYKSKFREFGPFTLENLKKEEEERKKIDERVGIVDEGEEQKELEDELIPSKKKKNRNKRLAARLAQQKEGDDEGDAKAKGKAPPKKEEKKDDKKDKKGKKGDEEEEDPEEVQRRKEAEEAEQRRKDEIISKFNQKEELKKLGGTILQFDEKSNRNESQHYSWYVPIFFKDAEKEGTNEDCKKIFIQVRTTTVKRSLIPQIEMHDFGEIPVAFRKTAEILIKNVGSTTEDLRMEALTPYGGFSVLNAMRSIAPGKTKPVLVEFKPFTQQIYEETLKIYSNQTVASVKLKGRGVRPEVRMEPEDGLLYFGNVLIGENSEKEFVIKNVSSFPVKFNLIRKADGIQNSGGLRPFTYIPQEGIVEAESQMSVKIIFHPDRASNDYFEILKLDVPNQVQEKKIYCRGYSYTRQNFAREEFPFIWRDIQFFKKKYEEPLMLRKDAALTGNPRIVLEFVRSDDETMSDEEKEKRTVRKLTVGACRLLDNKLEKNGAYELNPPDGEKYFECDNAKGALGGGNETILNFTFTPPQIDPLLKDIGALRGIGQWVESVWECKIQGGFVEPGEPDPLIYDVVLRAYSEQI